MAQPVIDFTVSALTFVLGRQDSRQFAASNTPTSWAITEGAVPEGMSLDTDTGLLSGTPTLPGAGTFKLTASNADPSTSDAVEVPWGVRTEQANAGSDTEELFVDLQSREVHMEGLLDVGEGAENLVWLLKKGDAYPIALAFFKGESVRPVKGLQEIRMSLKIEGNRPDFEITDVAGSFRQEGSYEQTRYLIDISLAGSKLKSWLAEAGEGELSKHVDLFAEIQWEWDYLESDGVTVTTGTKTTRTFPVRLTDELIT